MIPATDRTAQAFIDGCHFLDGQEQQRVALAMYQILLTGKAAQASEVSELSGVAVEKVRGWTSAWPAVFLDEDGAVTGFFGLTCDDGFSHRFDVAGVGTAWTWCTYDPLFIARVLNVTALVTSHCPVTGVEVRLTVTPEGVADVQPSTAVMSMMPPDLASFDDIIKTLCHFIWLFASPEAADEWTSGNPHTFVVPIEQGFEIGRRMTDSVFADVVGGATSRDSDGDT